MSVGEILDGAFVLLRRHFGLVLSIAIVCEGIPAAMDVYLDLTGGAEQSPGLSLLGRLLTLVGSVLVTGATVRVVSEAYLGRMPQFGDAMSFASSKFGVVFGARFMSGLLIGLATLALVIPGIIVGCGYSVAAETAALETGSSSDALRRSWELTKGFRSKALALGFVTICLILVLYLTAGLLGGLLARVAGGENTVIAVLSALVSLTIYPLLTFVFTLFYYDLRVRKEAFDIEMLSQQMEGAG
jgi:hypothetical protein